MKKTVIRFRDIPPANVIVERVDEGVSICLEFPTSRIRAVIDRDDARTLAEYLLAAVQEVEP